MSEILRDSTKRRKNLSIWNHGFFRCDLQGDDLKVWGTIPSAPGASPRSINWLIAAIVAPTMNSLISRHGRNSGDTRHMADGFANVVRIAPTQPSVHVAPLRLTGLSWMDLQTATLNFWNKGFLQSRTVVSLKFRAMDIEFAQGSTHLLLRFSYGRSHSQSFPE